MPTTTEKEDRALNSALALWWLESDQELVFTGDAGTTEANGKSHRYGIEWTNYYKPTNWLALDADFWYGQRLRLLSLVLAMAMVGLKRLQPFTTV